MSRIFAASGVVPSWQVEWLKNFPVIHRFDKLQYLQLHVIAVGMTLFKISQIKPAIKPFFYSMEKPSNIPLCEYDNLLFF